ncbi:peroxisomal N(1)-acetyl-spermine/spermidine oxidase-like [Carcharodon carcharias]|uniref:peroxisomal N(1)-acetyl-spermine/spermidine oxidase-like n=1 Tax=Carcharodon carcharias TaxID=13397 RepID=UPI001B7EC3FD|nr:peroxisomal N(1)-acetyl-spermine/spermidine oxidase-like [Carcharodon carcharias]
MKSLGHVYLEEIKELITNWTDDSPNLRSQKLGSLNMIMKDQCVSFSSQDLNDVSLQEINEYEFVEGDDLNSPRYGHILLGWSSGREAEFTETLSEEELASNITRILRQFTGKPVPWPKNVFVTKCFSNPHTQGSYSFISISSTGDMIDTLAEPLPQEGGNMLQILFAEETTHQSYNSTTHGALVSGWREADRLINHYSTSEEQHLQTKEVI